MRNLADENLFGRLRAKCFWSLLIILTKPYGVATYMSDQIDHPIGFGHEIKVNSLIYEWSRHYKGWYRSMTASQALPICIQIVYTARIPFM